MTSRYLLRKLPSRTELANAHPAWANYWKNLTIAQPRFNIGPHPHKTAALITHTGVQEMLFGMKPHWAKTLLLNAKAESIKHSQFWKPLAAMRPCLIPADGFYITEDLTSTHAPKVQTAKTQTNAVQNEQRTWHGVEFSDHRQFFLAGMWKPIKDNPNDKNKRTLRFVLLTRKSHSCIKNISPRMPVIFSAQEIIPLQIWMNTELSLEKRIDALIASVTFAELISFPVGNGIKNLGRDDASLFESV